MLGPHGCRGEGGEGGVSVDARAEGHEPPHQQPTTTSTASFWGKQLPNGVTRIELWMLVDVSGSMSFGMSSDAEEKTVATELQRLTYAKDVARKFVGDIPFAGWLVPDHSRVV